MRNEPWLKPQAVVLVDLDYVRLVALVNEGLECLFVFNFLVKMHLRFGSKAVDRQLWRRH